MWRFHQCKVMWISLRTYNVPVDKKRPDSAGREIRNMDEEEKCGDTDRASATNKLQNDAVCCIIYQI